MKNPCQIILLTSMLFLACGQHRQAQTANAKDTNFSVSHAQPIDYNDDLKESLQPIQSNVRRINAIKDWTDITYADLEESAEGGEAAYYYLDDTLEKLAARYFGETGQKITEFYTMHGQLSFVLEKKYDYNRPITWDSATMEANQDDQVIDIDKAEITEVRSYFLDGRLTSQAGNYGCTTSFAIEYLLEEQKRLKKEFDGLLEMQQK